MSLVDSAVSADYRAGYEVGLQKGLRKGRDEGRAQGFKDAWRAMTRANTAVYDRDFLLLAKTWFELKGEALFDEDESLEPSTYWPSKTHNGLECERVEDSPGSWHWEHTDECQRTLSH